ncbi:MAG TPA: hypothetical protein VMV46_05425 [Thermoanaerobaculia bacterium]|nr:hypothetical protein [Thermoanaerobaculia bacterium]
MKHAPSLETRRVLPITRAVAVLLVAVGGLAMAPGVAQEAPAAPTLAEVLSRHVEARGGLERIKAIETLEMRGVALAQGMELPIRAARARPALFFTETDFQGMQIVQAFDGVRAWGVNPMMGAAEASPLPDDEGAFFALQADFDGPLIDARRKRIQLELSGKETLGEREAWRIEIAYPGGQQETAFLDAESWLEVRRLGKSATNGVVVDMQTDFLDYTEVEGVKVASRWTIGTPMGPLELRLDQIEANGDLDRDVFYPPGQEADPSLTLEQILERHAAARAKGGAAAVSSLRATGTLTVFGLKLPLVMSFARPRSARLEADMQGVQLILAYDGETAWTVSPMQGITEPEALPAEAAEAIALFADFLWGLLADREAKGWSVELAGVEEVERDQAYKLALRREDGQVRALYLGGEDFLERKVQLEAVFMGSQQVIDALLSDYREVDGVMVPGRIEILTGGTPAATVEVEAAQTGVELEPGIFSLPVAGPQG